MNFIDDHSRLAVASAGDEGGHGTGGARGVQRGGARWGFRCGPSDRQRLRLHDLASRWTQRDADRAARARGRLPPLPPLPPSDLREGRAVPPDDADVLGQATGASSIGELQRQVDRFVAYYNEVRPHRATGRRPPKRRSMHGTRPGPRGRRSGWAPGCACGGIGSTRMGRSRFDTRRSCITSAWVTPQAQTRTLLVTASMSGSSPRTESCSAPHAGSSARLPTSGA